MGLTASMWTSVSGLITHGEEMNVVGNNIANVNTVGFKSQRMDFQDFVYQNSYSASGITQIGRGVEISSIHSDFAQGTLESTTSVTDLAITGEGFFKVNVPGLEQSYYTRAGNFDFNNQGQLVNPEGLVLQGWKIDNSQGPTRASGTQAAVTNSSQIQGTGLPTDVVLDTRTVPPLQTTNISFNVNLSPTATSDASSNLENPFTSLLSVWNGTQPPAPNSPSIPESAYSYAVPIDVYDEAGGKHTLTMYIDQVGKDTYQGAASNQSIYEYILTMDPAEDMRQASIPNPAWQVGAVEGDPADPLPVGSASVFTTPIPNPPTTEPTLQAGYALDTTKYTFVPATAAADPNLTLLDAFDPHSWPEDVFGYDPVTGTGTQWPEMRGGEEPYTVVDMKNTKSGGLLMAGTLTFDGAGSLINQTAYTINGTKTPIQSNSGGFIAGNGYNVDDDGNPVPIIDPDNPADYLYPTEISANGYPMLVANFTGQPGADVVGSVPDADRYLMEVDFGLKVSNYSNPWQNNSSLGTLEPPTTSNAALYDPANDKMGPYEYTAANRIANPNYSATENRGPEYIYLNPNYADSDSNYSISATGEHTLTLTSPQYLYDKGALDALDPAIFTALETVLATPQTWTPPNTPADVQTLVDAGILSLDTTSGRVEWGTKYAQNAILADPGNLANMTEPTIKESNAFTASGSSNVTISVGQNGYGRGDLAGYDIDANGVISGIYTNNVTLPLYQIAIYDFTDKQALRREGGNLYSETLDSGQPSVNVAGANGKGTISAMTLEGSNTDLSREFVNMIVTQRGFQSNSKMITTVDLMLETVINMKR